MTGKPIAISRYTETRLNLDPAYPASVVSLQIPSTSSSWNPLASSASNITRPNLHDDATFTKYTLATDSSIYFRRENRSPRSFLWRLLNDQKLLELQVVDLTQLANEKTEALLTVRLHFPHAIIPHGLAFADSEHHDALQVFALTTQNDLIVLDLQKDLFVHQKISESLPSDWHSTFSPPALRIRQPYRLFAVNSKQLFISLSDGALLQLDHRNSQWEESYYSIASWSMSLPKPLARWRGENFISYNGIDLNAAAAASVELSPDEQHIITVCLNHTLRIWSIATGKVVFEHDLQEMESLSSSQSKFLLEPRQKQLLQVIDTPGQDEHLYYLVIFSPQTHQFSFWAVFDADQDDELAVRIQSDFEFLPPIESFMESSSWNLEEFHLQANRGWSDTSLWIRARAGPVSQVFKIKFSLFADIEELEESWNTGWETAAAGFQSIELLNEQAPPEVQLSDSSLHCPSVTENWLQFLFYPGRFTIETLEAALHVYTKGNNNTSKTTKSKSSLQERISNAILSKASTVVTDFNYDLLEVTTSEQWHIFYGVLQDFHKRRSNTLSFVVDTSDNLPWLISTDIISCLRLSTDIEICGFHRIFSKNVSSDVLANHLKSTTYEVIDLLDIACLFRSSLSPSFQNRFRRLAIAEVLQDPSVSVQDRIISFHEAADIAISISQEEWDQFQQILEDHGGYQLFDFANFSAILEQLEQASTGKDQGEQITRYGVRTLIRASQETLSLQHDILLDLLLLTVFLDAEVDRQELDTALEAPWQGEYIFNLVATKLQELVVLDFLMGHIRIERMKRPRSQSFSESPGLTKSNQETFDYSYSHTLMESLFVGDWAAIQYEGDSELSELITYWARRWITSQDLSNQYESFTEHVFADLLKHHDDVLCAEFLPYTSNSYWAMYLRGRYHLRQANFDKAATCFGKAAFGLAVSDFAVKELDTASLLRPDERDFFGHGLATYYEHIMDLFVTSKCIVYVTDFAQTAIQHLALEPLPSEKRGGKTSSKTSNLAANRDQKSASILSRLFSAALDSAQYTQAYSALVRIPDHSIQRASLSSLASTLISSNNTSTLLSLPFAQLAPDLDTAVSRLALQSISQSTFSSLTGAYFRALYALRSLNGDFQGAAQALWDYLATFKGDASLGPASEQQQQQRIEETYLLVINALRCCGSDEAWVLDDPAFGAANGSARGVKFAAKLVAVASGAAAAAAAANGGEGSHEKKRKIVFLEEIRTEYQALLDRVSDLEGGRFEFAIGDEMELS